MSPQKVGAQIAKYLSRRKIRASKVFGTIYYKFVVFLNKTLPKRWMTWGVYNIYCKGKK